MIKVHDRRDRRRLCRHRGAGRHHHRRFDRLHRPAGFAWRALPECIRPAAEDACRRAGQVHHPRQRVRRNQRRKERPQARDRRQGRRAHGLQRRAADPCARADRQRKQDVPRCSRSRRSTFPPKTSTGLSSCPSRPS